MPGALTDKAGFDVEKGVAVAGVTDDSVFADFSASGICVRAIAGDGGAVMENVHRVDPDDCWSGTASCCKSWSKNRFGGELTR